MSLAVLTKDGHNFEPVCMTLACMCAQMPHVMLLLTGMFAFGDTMHRLLCLTTGCYEYMHGENVLENV